MIRVSEPSIENSIPNKEMPNSAPDSPEASIIAVNGPVLRLVSRSFFILSDSFDRLFEVQLGRPSALSVWIP
jgi:hypothetical protein